jgi:cardiolipin synthase
MSPSNLYLVVSGLGLAFLGFLLFLALFEPPLPYRLSRRPSVPLDSEEFRRLLAALGSGVFHACNNVEVLTNGEVYYEAELEAIRGARQHVNIEAYIFQKGEVTRRFLEVLTERARAGVHVNMVVDAVGSFATWSSYFRDLCAAGGRVGFYHRIRWYNLPRINNRTHRELIVVDGRVGFIGGAGFGDHWLLRHGRGRRNPPSRRTGWRRRGKCWPTSTISNGAKRAGRRRPWWWPALPPPGARHATG